MGYAILATWKMAYEGVQKAAGQLAGGDTATQALETAISTVEDNPNFVSLGTGGLPNKHGEVELDAAFMDGNTLQFGGVIEVQNIRNPIKVAIRLSQHRRNCLLAGKGAEMYAQQNGFAFTNLLSGNAKSRWAKSVEEKFDPEALSAYAGHDTVCMIGLDSHAGMAVGTSTSGLFMKHPGRVGDSPVIGSGFYCDSQVGGASVTGVGEDCMKGVLSYEMVRRMAGGMTPQQACESTLFGHLDRLVSLGHSPGVTAVIAMDKNGNFGAAQNIDRFAFVYANQNQPVTIYMSVRDEKGHITIAPATQAEIQEYIDP